MPQITVSSIGCDEDLRALGFKMKLYTFYFPISQCLTHMKFLTGYSRYPEPTSHPKVTGFSKSNAATINTLAFLELNLNFFFFKKASFF